MQVHPPINIELLYKNKKASFERRTIKEIKVKKKQTKEARQVGWANQSNVRSAVNRKPSKWAGDSDATLTRASGGGLRGHRAKGLGEERATEPVTVSLPNVRAR